jgi:LuxR family maltose regulon positive regulatory protein
MRTEDPFWQVIGRARVEVAEARFDEALDMLEAAPSRCDRHEVVLTLLRARATRSREKATKLVASAIDLASANGMLQTVASEGHDVVSLVEPIAWRVPEAWIDRLRRAATGTPVGAHVGADLAGGRRALLTERERDVLRFLPSRLTLREIAGELGVSVNTLKFHLRLIYQKLGVASRSEAAVVARKLVGSA